jgi:hypothetical protein
MFLEVPSLFRDRDSQGKEIIVMYHITYGRDHVLPDGKSVIAIRMTHDNAGAHKEDRLIRIFDEIQTKYPNAKVRSTSLSEVQAVVETNRDLIPVITSEMGDTWIYGCASAPLRMARFRALSRLYSEWLREGKITMDDPVAIAYALRLALVAEHTWGADTKNFMPDWTRYDVDPFNEARTRGDYWTMEESWREQDRYVDEAIALLPDNLRAEAEKHIEDIGKVVPIDFKGRKENIKNMFSSGAMRIRNSGMEMTVGSIAYQLFSYTDYQDYRDRYLRHDRGWVFTDFGKPGLQRATTESVTVTPSIKYAMTTKTKDGSKISAEVEFPEHKSFDKRVYPEKMYVEYILPKSGNSIDVNVSIVNKPAVRFAEAYWFSFVPEHIMAIIADKMGERVDVMDVVKQGNRQMHGIDTYVDIVTTKGTVRITSYDAPVVAVGERNALNFSKRPPDITKGVHFCLSNNLWGTNFRMWYEGSMTYRFKIEFLNN